MDINGFDRTLVGSNGTAHAAWLDLWAPPCPLSNPQWPCACLAYRERDPGRLQLRVPLAANQGICHIVVDEQPDLVYVRVLLCVDPHAEDDEWPPGWCDCPVDVHLDAPLGERGVFDIETDDLLPLYTPA